MGSLGTTLLRYKILVVPIFCFSMYLIFFKVPFETNGVLFAVLKRRVLQKKHRHPPDMTSGLSLDTVMYPHEYKNLHKNSRWANKMKRKREKNYIQSDQPDWNPGGASATPWPRKNPVFDYAAALCTMQNELLVISNLTWLDHFGAPLQKKNLEMQT
jgi:hypothetical protein